MEFTNQAQLTYNDKIINSNIAVGEVTESLAVTKTAVMDDYTRNDDVTYVISIVNSGITPLNGVSVTDNLGAYEFNGETLYPLTFVEDSVRYYINGVFQTVSPDVTAGPPLVFSGINVPAGGNAMIIYETDVTRFAPLEAGSTIENTATLENGESSARRVLATATETISVEEEPDLTITKSIVPVPVNENGTVTYTFVIQNYGNTAAVATDDVTVTDTFDPVLTDITVTLNGDPLSSTADYTYSEETGVFVTTPGRITVPAATYTRDENGSWIITPGVTTLTVTGTI